MVTEEERQWLLATTPGKNVYFSVYCYVLFLLWMEIVCLEALLFLSFPTY